MLFCRQFGFQRRRRKRLSFYILSFWIKAKKSVVGRRLDSFQNVYVVLSGLFWTLSSSRLKQIVQLTSLTRIVIRTTIDQMPSFLFSAFQRLVCSGVIFSKRKSFYVFIAFSTLSRRYAKGKGIRLLFGISFAFRLCRGEVCCNPQL